MFVVADDFIGGARIEQWQCGAVPADLHHFINQAVDGPVLALFPQQSLAQGPNDCLRDGLAGPLISSRANLSASGSLMLRGIDFIPRFLILYLSINRSFISERQGYSPDSEDRSARCLLQGAANGPAAAF